ncbi:glycosyltransferase family A protein [Tamlana sp. 2201CG12-4]|uniref:glycosyltransferase family 2 protein n=1 Tax=Tamlana sp. 2201CG12-4 TaxID=3112582 RepID=UPI002DBEB8CB|nr:glycosyltransferase family A protein [Tamlana sp. 2201CG12-4]MEC3907338.1 glycosyltransferase family A protein [Tamlana sp. 2201CG12-4]
MLAIVVPYYKSYFFEETLKSLAIQTDNRFHVYIGDDASDESPEELLKKYEDQFAFTYHRFQYNLGGMSLVKQWERCLEMIKDEVWVQILGDDDVLSANTVSMFYEHLGIVDQEDSNVIRFATQVINEKGALTSGVYKHPVLESSEEFLIRKYKGGTRSSLSEYIFRKEKIDAIKFKDFPLAWSSDTLGIIEFSENKAIYTINDTLVFFRRSDKNITGQVDSVEKNEAWFRFYLYVLSNYGKTYSEELVTMLFDRIEKAQLNNKKTPLRWVKLFWLYLIFKKYSRFFSLRIKIKNSIK